MYLVRMVSNTRPLGKGKTMKKFSYTIYPRAYDPARGWRPAMVGITFSPTPNLTRKELDQLVCDLVKVSKEMGEDNA